MPNYTTRLALPKPLTSEAYDVGIHNAAMDLIDAAPANVTICTSSTRPGSPDEGDLIYETDSANILLRQGSAWKAHNGKVFICTSGTRPSSSLSFGGMVIFETDTASTYVRNAANTAWIFMAGVILSSTDVLTWAGDTNLYRSAANVLKTDDSFIALGVSQVARPYAHAYQSATQTLTTSVWDAITMGAEIVDNISGHSTSTNTDRYTPNVAGYYRCLGMAHFAANTTGDRAAQFRKNGSQVDAAAYGPMPAMNGSVFVAGAAWAAGTIALNGSTDYVSLYATHNIGSNLATEVVAGVGNSFAIYEWVAPL